tara:strand:+ start:11029 stop:11397 length:369 start_codon:yes stop_codon:yes gene_type:complete
MKIGPITSGAIPPMQVKKQDANEQVTKSLNDVKKQDHAPTKIDDNPRISTEGFISLRVESTKESPFAELDRAIDRINKNVEELGDALEGMIEKFEKVSKMAIGIQLLEQTFEAIDKLREGPK